MTQHVTPPGDDEDDEIEAIPLEDADLDADEIVEELEEDDPALKIDHVDPDDLPEYEVSATGPTPEEDVDDHHLDALEFHQRSSTEVVHRSPSPQRVSANSVTITVEVGDNVRQKLEDADITDFTVNLTVGDKADGGDEDLGHLFE